MQNNGTVASANWHIGKDTSRDSRCVINQTVLLWCRRAAKRDSAWRVRAKKQDLLDSLSCEVSSSAASPHGCLLLPALQHALPNPSRGRLSIAQQTLHDHIPYWLHHATFVHSTDQAQTITPQCQPKQPEIPCTIQMDELTASNSRLVEDLIEVDNDVAHLSAHLSATRTRTLHTTTLSEQLTQELQMLQRVSCLQAWLNVTAPAVAL